jgi:MFS family permease
MFSTEGFLLPVWIASVLGGFFWAGFNIVSFVWPQRICGENDQQHAYGILGIVSGPAFALGSILGGTFTTVLPQVLFRIGSFEFRHFHFVFALSSLGRLLAVLLISRHSLPFDRKGRTIPQAIVDSFRQIVGWQ